MQQVFLELEHVNFFCPVTGQRITGEEHFSPSPATMFVYIDEIGDCEMIHPTLEPVWKLVQAESSDDDCDESDFERFSKQVGDSVVCFTISVSGMACGPVGETARIGIDMSLTREE